MFDEALQGFVAKVNEFPRLGADEEKDLARRWRDHRDEAAAHKIVCSHLGYVIAIATTYRRYQVPLAELVAEGNLGLLRALDKFDPELDIRFVTYAGFWVRSHVISHILKNWSIANTGSAALRSKIFFKLRREGARARALFGEGPEFETEVARRTGLTVGRVRAMLSQLDSADVSLDEPISEGGQSSKVDFVEADAESSHEVVSRQESSALSRRFVHSALRVLDRREAFIIKHRLLVADGEELSLAELGRQIGVSRERARQLEARARMKLRTELEREMRSAGVSARELLPAA